MAWPTVTIDTTSMDAATDSPATARDQIRQMADNVNGIKDARGQASGVCELDAASKVPASRVPTVPATQGGTGQTVYVVGDLLAASSASALSRLAAGAAGQVLKSNGPAALPSWQSDSAFAAGTRLLFQQTAAPTGWTKEVGAAYNDIALRVVTGTVGGGGSSVFSATFGTGKTTGGYALAIADIPAHSHSYLYAYTGAGNGLGGSAPYITTGAGNTTGNTGGGGAHSHPMPALDLKYSDVIIAIKN